MNGTTTAAPDQEATAARVAPVAPGPDVRLHTLVERHAAATPAAFAVVCDGRRLTYAALDADANRLAHRLREVGVGPEVPVAIRLPRSTDQLVAMVAVWKAGGCYVPLDDEHPADRVAGLLTQLVRTVGGRAAHEGHRPGAGEDAGTGAVGSVLVTCGEERVAAGEAAGVGAVVCLERDAVVIAAQPQSPPGVAVPLDGLAAIIHTSGSTGTPKPVALTHRNVLSAQVGRDDFPAQPRRVLLPVSFAFDVFLSFSVWALRVGGQVVVPVQPRGADLDELATLLTSLRITHLVCPPDLQRALLARAEVRAENSIMVGVVGGQSCPRTLVQDYQRSTRGGRLVNEYALTETSAGTHFVADEPAPSPATDEPGGAGGADRAAGAGQLPIGWPATECRVHLLDEDLRPVAQGVTAEVFIGGPGLARGYLGRPGLTAERFVADPFGEPGGRLYRTGDLARARANGALEFQGRRDRQVKIRGYRIELAEIEAALATHDGVGSGAVCHFPEREELIAYVIGRVGSAPPSGADLLAHLRRLLPEPMVPSAVVLLDVMPLTPHGKIDRAALTELGNTAVAPAAVVTGPRTSVEATIAQVWADVLELDTVDVHADFFALGGHSLLAASVLSRLRKEFTATIALRDLFSATTVAALAALVTARGEPTAPADERRAAVAGLPATTSPDGGSALRWAHDGPGEPLVCVHGGDGLTHAYKPVVDTLPDRPVALVDWPGTGSVEDVARGHADVLTTTRPYPGYTVFGWSGGAAVTWALAHELAGRGHRVELVLLDPMAESPRHSAFDADIEAAARFVDPATTPAEAARMLPTLIDRFAERRAAETDLGVWHDWVTARLALMRANRAHPMVSWPGTLRLLVSEDVTGTGHHLMGGLSYQEYVAHWRALAADVEIVPVSGDHDRAMTGAAAVLREGGTA